MKLSSLKSDLDAHGVGLYAVVHETLGANNFTKFFDGDVYFDEEVWLHDYTSHSDTEKIVILNNV